MKKRIIGLLSAMLFLITIFIMSSTVAYARTTLKITKQPVSITVRSGSTAKVTVSATGDGLKYKWYFKNSGDKKYSRTTTFTENYYSVKMNDSRNGRKIYCVITDKYGSSVKTNTVTLSEGTPLKITKQPVSVTVRSGSTAKVTVSATGDGLKYKWYFKNAGATKYSRTTTFTGNYYSVKMNDSRNGRKIYCVITDKYGSSVKTNAVTLTMGNPVKLTKQPVSVKVNCGSKAKATATATGDGLKYKWYYKNVGDTKFSLSKTFTGKSYSIKMNGKRDGRKVYCVITDKYGNSVKTKTVTLSTVHTYDSGVITKKPTCKLSGEKTFACTSCSKKVVKLVSKTAHSMGQWKVVREATVTSEGFERRNCSKCSYYNDRSIEKLKPVYYITVNTDTDKSSKVGVAEDGKYVLADPEKVGYVFAGWKDEKGNAFSSSGTIKANITVNAVWELDGTDTLAELVERTDAGVDRIVITKDITVNKPVYISYNTTIYADGDYTLKRAVDYAGDIFVVGRDKNGESAVVMQRKAVLTLGGGNGTLTIDGNKDNLKVNSVGSALFVSDSSVVNIYDGVKIVNNAKLGNERVFKHGSSSLDRAGGAAILNLNSTVNMYGGVISNNVVATEHTITTDETGAQVSNETNGCGGAVYNRGNFNMYGGTVSGNESLRGGGIYNDRMLYLYAGAVSDNLSHTYGGGVSSSSSSNADMHIGSEGDGAAMIFRGNHSVRAGGALYSNTSSPIIIYGNTEIVNNCTDTSGGAIYTAGPLTVNDTYFSENTCEYSGGAIYHHYTRADFERRLLTLTNCVFESNSGNLGGAVILSASDAVAETNLGTYASITDCQFIKNQAVITSSSTGGGNGGAIYVTRKSEADIEGCTFEENSAVNNAGAVAAQNNTKVQLSDCDFIKNTAVTGGAVSSAAGAVLNMTDIEFNGNNAILSSQNSGGDGGAAYIVESAVKINNVDFYNNTAANHAGAVYQRACELSFDSTSEFEGNSAGKHGGVFYLTYKTNSDKTKTGAKLDAAGVTFKNNTAMAGGAVSIRSACEATFDGASFIGNAVTGYDNKDDGDADGGGAVYVGYGKLTLNNVTATGNTASGHGGVVAAAGAQVNVTGGTFSENSASTGGAFNAISGSDVSFSGSMLSANESTYVQSGTYDTSKGGGAVRIAGGNFTVSGTTFDNNKAGYYGGAVLASGVTARIDGNSVVKSSAGATGAALHFSSKSDVTIQDISITENTSGGNGVVYFNNSTVNITNVTASGNKANNGGVIYTSNAKTNITVSNTTFTGNSANSGGVLYADSATVQFIGGEQSGNSAKNGGLVYSENANITFDDGTLNKNTATQSGGAIYTQDGTLAINSTVLSENEANGHGGAVYAKYTVVTLDGSTFDANKASANGGAVDIVGADVTATGANKFSNNTAAGHGGAVYVVYYTETVTGTDDEGNETSTEVTTRGKLNMTDGSFENNSAMGGGAVSIRTGCEVTLEGTTLNGNSVTGYDDKNYGAEDDGDGEGGGAIYVGYGKLTLNNVTATGNTASGFGGAVDAVKATVEVNGGTFKNNIASTGGAFNSIYGSDISFNGTTLSENESTYVQSGTYDSSKGGGAVKISGGNLTVSGTTLDGNKTGYYGGAVLASGVTVTIGGNSVVTNSTGSTGAALYFRDSCKTTMENVTVSDNKSNSNGVIYSNSGTLNMTNVTVTGNSANNGGVIYVSGGSTNVTLTNSTWSGNSAKYGGTIHMTDASVTVIGGEMKANNATLGGVAFNKNGKLEINGVTFTENTATKDSSGNNGNGGVISLSGGTLTAITGDNKFADNSAENHGGAVYVSYSGNTDGSKNPGVVNMKDGSFENNSAMAGGAVSIRSDCEATFDGTSFTGNSVSGYATESDGDGEGGGAIYVGFGTVTLTNVTATGNKAEQTTVAGTDGTETVAYGFGGVVDAVKSTVTVTGGTYSGNEATYGGVLNAYNYCTVNVTGSNFSSNKATTGGAVYLDYGSSATIGDSTLDGNSATGGDGGAIVIADLSTKGTAATTLNMTIVTLQNNTASAKGGAVSTDTSSPNLVINATDCTFSGNSATGAGAGAVEIQNGNSSSTEPTEIKLVFTNCTFTSNNAKTTGGAMEIRSSSCAKVDGITATGNKAKGNGGVIYVTSNHSRVYLTGEVTVSDNTSTGGTFIHLWNSNYSNPPKLYTTASNSAAWYSEVGGNSTNVAFDLTAMP